MEPADWMALGEIDPDLEKLLKSLPPAPPLPTTIEGLAELFDKLRATRPPPPPETKAGVHEYDTTIPADDGPDVAVRIYKPENAPADGSPLIIYMHGGGFCLGSPTTSEIHPLLYVQKFGAVAISIDYRLAPAHPFPAAPNDCWAVVKWAAANASTLGADTSKGFILAGASAGGNLSLVLALKAIEEGLSPAITGINASIPATSDYKNIPEEYKDVIRSYDQNAKAPGMGIDLVQMFLDAYKPVAKSPLYDVLANQKHFGSLPPIYFQICGMDPLRDEAFVFERLIRTKHNIKTKVDIYPGLPHSYWTFFPMHPAAGKAYSDEVEGVAWLLQQK